MANLLASGSVVSLRTRSVTMGGSGTFRGLRVGIRRRVQVQLFLVGYPALVPARTCTSYFLPGWRSVISNWWRSADTWKRVWKGEGWWDVWVARSGSVCVCSYVYWRGVGCEVREKMCHGMWGMTWVVADMRGSRVCVECESVYGVGGRTRRSM